MDLQEFVENVPNLTDLELAVLLSLIASQHCLVYTDDDLLDPLALELALIVSETFRLSYVVIGAEELQSLDRFGDAILDDNHKFASESDYGSDDASAGLKSRTHNVSFKDSRSSHIEPALDSRMVVNVVIAKDFNHACHDVQVQVMELMLKRRIFSRTTVHHVPKTFLFLPVVAYSSKHIRLNHHLNGRIFMSHTHSIDDGFPNLEDMEDMKELQIRPGLSLTTTASSSIPHVKRGVVDRLRALGQAASMTPEIRRYLQDIVVFMRVERGVDGGVTAYGNVCFVDLAKYLAPLHGLDFVTPSLIGLAARKIFPHRITIAAPERERSVQFGSDVAAVKQSLAGTTPEIVIEAVLAKPILGKYFGHSKVWYFARANPGTSISFDFPRLHQSTHYLRHPIYNIICGSETTSIMANRNPTPLTQQDFGDLWTDFPRSTRSGTRGGLGRDLPAGGTDDQYRYIQILDIAFHDMSSAAGFMTTYIEIECTRLRLHTGRAAFTTACRQALLAAWNASYHLAPGGGFSFWANERTPEEQLMNSRWPEDRRKVIAQINLAVSTDAQLATQNPAPAPLYSLPQWYTNDVAAEHARLAAIPPLMMGPYPVTAPPTAPPAAAGPGAAAAPPAPVLPVPAAAPATVTATTAAAPTAPNPPNNALQWANETQASLAARFGGTVWEYTASDEEAWNVLG